MNINSLRKRISKLEEKQPERPKLFHSYEECETDEGNLIEFISSFIGFDFVKRLEPITEPLQAQEIINKVLKVLTVEELTQIIESEEEE